MGTRAGDRRVSVPKLAWHITRPKRFVGSKAPGPRGAAALRTLLTFTRNPLRTIAALRARYGDLVRLEVRLPGAHFAMHVVTEAELARHVLVTNQHNYRKAFTYAPLKAVMGNGLLTSEDDLWKTQRRLIQPMFHRDQLATMAAPMRAASADLVERWREIPPSQPIEVLEHMSSLTLDIVGRALFGDTLGADGPRVSHAVGLLSDLALKAFTNPVYWPFATRPERVPVKRYRDAVKTIDGVIFGMIDHRRDAGGAGDLLGKLMSARDAASGAAMSDVQIRDELMTFMLAGHETTATVLTWTFHLLAQHPDVRARLHDELASELGGEVPSAGQLDHLPYTRAVILEAMRLYPPAWFVDREADADDDVGGYAIALAAIAQAYDLEAVPGHIVVPNAEVTLRPKGGLPMFVRPRS